MDLSVVLPVYNERENLQTVYDELCSVLERVGEGEGKGEEDTATVEIDRWELIFVDDGSTDGSYERLQDLYDRDERVAVIRFGTNFGQSAALDAGIRYATGEVIVTMDSDGQNDPADIPRLIDTLEREEYDCVVGWRRDRADPFTKTFASEIARILRRTILDTELHDFGCTLKAFRREAADAVDLTGEMHRYIPPLLSWRGFDVGEVEVNHRERAAGETKYSWQRLPKGFIDMLNVWFWQKYSGRPLHVFGGLGVLAGTIGFFGGMYSVYLKAIHAVSLSDTALPLFAVFMCLLGIQFFISGILADIGIKNYFAVRQGDVYRVATVLDGRELADVADTSPPARATNVFQQWEGGDGARSDA